MGEADSSRLEQLQLLFVTLEVRVSSAAKSVPRCSG